MPEEAANRKSIGSVPVTPLLVGRQRQHRSPISSTLRSGIQTETLSGSRPASIAMATSEALLILGRTDMAPVLETFNDKYGDAFKFRGPSSYVPSNAKDCQTHRQSRYPVHWAPSDARYPYRTVSLQDSTPAAIAVCARQLH